MSTADDIARLKQQNATLLTMVRAALRGVQEASQHIASLESAIWDLSEDMGGLSTHIDDLDTIIARMRSVRVKQILDDMDATMLGAGGFTDKADFDESLASVQDLS